MDAKRPTNETERIAALRSYNILDTEPDRDFDDLVRVASLICEAPIALVTLVDDKRQWFKARVGLDVPETPREHAFCAHVVEGDATMVVPDAEADVRFRDNPLVVGHPNIRFYAGAPLLTAEGHGLGTLCVIDSKPRVTNPLSAVQLESLEALSRQAVRLLELRRSAALLADALDRVKLLSPLVPICAWCKRIRDDSDYWSSISEYLRAHAGVDSSHGICPDCVTEHVPRPDPA